MPDREKVIDGLKELSGFLFKEYGKAQAEEANLYYDRFLAVDNAIALLKEQEAFEPKISTVEQRCGNCNKVIDMDGWKACPWCGKLIDWEGWWSKNGRNRQDFNGDQVDPRR